MATTLEEDLITALAGVTAYPDAIKEDATFPCAVYQQVSDYQGRSHSGNTLRRPRFQIACYGTSKKSSVDTANSVIAKLDLNRTNFELATKENQFSTVEKEPNLYVSIVDFFIWSGK